MRTPPPAPSWASSLFTVGVTGTNGKTTTTAWVAAMLAPLGRPVARVTTVGSFLDERRLEGPAHYEGFLRVMRRCLEAGGSHAAVELTSEALAMGFARAWPFRVGVFTNLTHDHSDVHGSPEHYLASKAQLFMALPAGGVAVLNARDPASALLAEVIPPWAGTLWYGVPSRGEPCTTEDLTASAVRPGWRGTTFELNPSARFPDLPASLSIRGIGAVFVENALAALGAALAAGVRGSEASAALEAASPPPGRFEVVSEHPHAVIDYAHTPDALARTLGTARALCRGRLTVVFGAGGQRDRAKRPLLGAAARVADRIVLTSDNPRAEDPHSIIAQIAEGIGAHGAVVREVHRARAIRLALRGAAPDDVVIIAGKGHERSQEGAGGSAPFSDAEAVLAALNKPPPA